MFVEIYEIIVFLELIKCRNTNFYTSDLFESNCSEGIILRPPKIIDNKRNGKVVTELRENVIKGSKLSVISAYFTIYAYEELKKGAF